MAVDGRRWLSLEVKNEMRRGRLWRSSSPVWRSTSVERSRARKQINRRKRMKASISEEKYGRRGGRREGQKAWARVG
ncbi:hypothetical protein L6452_10932 [Arctium lappa]|uniref:Uncharacterized protein n=1 Tax=Arctium lappa TaxID=4217 RepID=A0ACB9DP57_ARCLA|nr:hypothetical protein L6452_10932 [Arctium lappa]